MKVPDLLLVLMFQIRTTPDTLASNVVHVACWIKQAKNEVINQERMQNWDFSGTNLWKRSRNNGSRRGVGLRPGRVGGVRRTAQGDRSELLRPHPHGHHRGHNHCAAILANRSSKTLGQGTVDKHCSSRRGDHNSYCTKEAWRRPFEKTRRRRC